LMEMVVQQVTSLIEAGSYPMITGLMILESALLPVPSEVIMPFSGFLVSRGKLDLALVVLSGTLGNLIGSLLAYTLGLKITWSPIKNLPLVGREAVRAERFMAKHGDISVLLGRMMPGVRTFISLPAGLSRMNPLKFSAYTLIGSIPWNLLMTYLGVILGEQWEIISAYLDPLTAAVFLIILAYFLLRGDEL